MYTRKGLTLCAALLLAAVALTALVPVLPARAEGNAPVAQNLELTTYRNVSVGGRLTAVDPDGDTLTFQITTEPTKGEIELTDDGRFVYTPDTNRRGRDYFGFKAVDAEGNSSQGGDGHHPHRKAEDPHDLFRPRRQRLCLCSDDAGRGGHLRGPAARRKLRL
ncbi:MAG: Ig-like domain-containing protein [Lachnospiraceae bacterium]